MVAAHASPRNWRKSLLHVATIYIYSPTPPPFGRRDWGPHIQLHLLKEADSTHPAELNTDWQTADIETFISKIVRFVRREGLDVLHFHYAVPFAYVAAAVKHILGDAAPLIVGTLHGTDVVTHGAIPDTNWRLRQAFGQVDYLTAVSHHHAQLAQQIFQLPQLPKVIPNFTSPSQIMSKPPNKKRPFRLIHLSNFRPIKHTTMLAHIFVKVQQQLDAELWLIGDGPEMAVTQRILKVAGVEPAVRYWGLQTNVAPILAQGDLLLVTSHYESFCMAALEGMENGLVVLATHVGGLPELVVHNGTGFLLPPNDEGAFVRAIHLLNNQPAQLDRMKTAAKQRAALFSPEAAAAAYEKLYQQSQAIPRSVWSSFSRVTPPVIAML
ncbi:MAG: glycosyltransferase [Chloroflexota bacterium]